MNTMPVEQRAPQDPFMTMRNIRRDYGMAPFLLKFNYQRLG